MTAITISGLSSQLDTDAIIEALVAARTAQLVTPLQNRGIEIQTRQTTLSAFQAYMASLQTAASTLKDITVSERSASSSSSKLSLGTVESTAASGTYNVSITHLATVDRVYYNGVADTDTTTFGTGTLTIASNGVSKNITIDSSNNTLQGIADAINDTDGINVSASIVNDGTGTPYRLVLTSDDTGDDANITSNIASVLSLTEDAALITANDSIDAEITVNSLTITQSTNEFTDVIPGVSFTINDTETETPIVVEVSDDTSNTVSAINSFVSAYNTLANAYSAQFTYSESTQSLGALGSDFTLQNTQSKIKSIVFGIYNAIGNSTYQSLSSIGISVDSDGVMSLDSDKLQEALDANPDEVQNLFEGTSTHEGLAVQLYDYLDGLTNSTDGVLVQKYDGYTDMMDSLSDTIADRETRVASYEASLVAKFVYLEQVMTELNAMQATLDSFATQMEALNSSSD